MQYNSDGTIRFDIGSAQRVVTATATKAMTAVLGAHAQVQVCVYLSSTSHYVTLSHYRHHPSASAPSVVAIVVVHGHWAVNPTNYVYPLLHYAPPLHIPPVLPTIAVECASQSVSASAPLVVLSRCGIIT